VDAKGIIRAPVGHKIRAYVTDRAHTFTGHYPRGWPTWLQATVGKSYYMENLADPMMPPAIDPRTGNVLGFQQVCTADWLANLDKEKITEQCVAYGDREAEITRALTNIPKSWQMWLAIGLITLGMLISGILGYMTYSKLSEMVSLYGVTGG
jgi:hypothetical protein